ncbi:hypothetical protein VME0621_04673 [Vibrio mediterranei]|nr:hypothetical protein VME0621_04673 [Vibrio mediterranei]
MQALSSWIFSFDGVFTLLAITLVSILLFSVWVGYTAHRLSKEQAKNHPPKKSNSAN